MLTIPVVVLVLGSMSLVLGVGTRSILNPGMHGLSEIMYAYASVAQNNGSAFAGLAANTSCYDVTLGLTMGRWRAPGCTRGPGPPWTRPGLTFAGFLVG